MPFCIDPGCGLLNRSKMRGRPLSFRGMRRSVRSRCLYRLTHPAETRYFFVRLLKRAVGSSRSLSIWSRVRSMSTLFSCRPGAFVSANTCRATSKIPFNDLSHPRQQIRGVSHFDNPSTMLRIKLRASLQMMFHRWSRALRRGSPCRFQMPTRPLSTT